MAGGPVLGRAEARPRELTRIAVIADTHLPRGARRLPDECLALLSEAGRILHAGDFVAASVLEELQRLAPVEAVYGNMDSPELQAALPERRVVSIEGVRVGLVHIPGPGAGRAERLVGWFPGCAVVVYGHTHMPELVQHRGLWILNPVSPTERRRAPGHSMALLDVDGSSVRVSLYALT